MYVVEWKWCEGTLIIRKLSLSRWCSAYTVYQLSTRAEKERIGCTVSTGHNVKRMCTNAFKNELLQLRKKAV